MNDKLKKIHEDWFYNNPSSRFNRFCVHCDHRCDGGEEGHFCAWYGEDCIEAAWHSCPIPTACVVMMAESDAVMQAHIKGKLQRRKGGTIVPPSDFQSVSTESVDSKHVTRKTLRPHGSARAHSRKEPLAPSENSAQICGKTDCPYYGHMATYCRICSKTKEVIHNRHPDMCANLLWGSCDGHACKCDRYVDFINWCSDASDALKRNDHEAGETDK